MKGHDIGHKDGSSGTAQSQECLSESQTPSDMVEKEDRNQTTPRSFFGELVPSGRNRGIFGWPKQTVIVLEMFRQGGMGHGPR